MLCQASSNVVPTPRPPRGDSTILISQAPVRSFDDESEICYFSLCLP